MKIRYFVLGIIFFLLIILVWYHQKAYIIICGKIIYNEFERGDIELYYTEKLAHGHPYTLRNLLYLNNPGFYIIKVPKNYGNIYICARNRNAMNASLAYFISEPIKIEGKDIYGYDIHLKSNRLLMGDYKGETVTLSGVVYCNNCDKEAAIHICVYSVDWFRKVRLPPDIARIILPSPGKFNIKIPANIGEVCITAISVPKGERSGNSPACRRGVSDNNPITIKKEDIDNIDMVIN